MSRQAQKILNPFTKAVTPLATNTVSRLQDYSVQAVRRALGINRISGGDTLNLSDELKDSLRGLALTDFIISHGQVTIDNYVNKTFPALCRCDNTPVVLRILRSRDELEDYPFLLTSFASDNSIVGIYEDKETLAEVIKKAKATHNPIPENIIWRYISQICEEVMTLEVSVKIEPRVLCFYRGKVIHTGLASCSSMTELKELSRLDLYIAPEVLMHQPYTRAAQAFSVGCIAYELAALKPAFSNADSDDSAMEVMQLSHCPELPEEDEDDERERIEYSSELQDLIEKTVTRDPEERLGLEEIQGLALFNMNNL